MAIIHNKQNPDVREFEHMHLRRVISSVCLNVTEGNTQGSKSRDSDFVSNQPLEDKIMKPAHTRTAAYTCVLVHFPPLWS